MMYYFTQIALEYLKYNNIRIKENIYIRAECLYKEKIINLKPDIMQKPVKGVELIFNNFRIY